MIKMNSNYNIRIMPGINKLQRYLYTLIFLGNLVLCPVLNGQTNTETNDSIHNLSGLVIDAQTKLPVPAAQILSLNHEAAASSDEQGKFEIAIASPNEVLLIKAYDYNPREVAVRGVNNLEIELYSEVFTNPYAQIEGFDGPTRAVTTTNSLKGTDKTGFSSYISADEALLSNMEGDVRAISRSGICGLGSSIFIRGLNSINLNAQPLFVVDGVIWNTYQDITSLHDGFYINPLADINPDDIDNISIIRDGTSIYGSKGGNGVIIIKTKRGKDMATKIVANAIGGINEKPGSLPVMNGDQFRIYATDLLGTMDLSRKQVEELDYLQDNPENISYNKFHNLTNWDNEIYNQGKFQSYNISVIGGDERALYALSMGYTGMNNVIKTTDMQRLNTRFNADFTLSKIISMGLNVGFTNIDRHLLDDGTNFYNSPSYLAMIKPSFLNPYSYTISGTLTTDVEDSDVFNISNPVAIIENSLNTNKHYRLSMGLKPVFQISPSFSFSDQIDYSLDKIKETYYSPIVGVADQYIEGLGLSENVFKNQQMRTNFLFNNATLQYIHLFGNIHRVNASVGWRYLSNSFESDYAEGHNSGSDQKRNLLSEEDFKNTSGKNDEIRSVSNYANVNYSYDNRYFVTATASVDGSSCFGNETQGGIQLFNRSWGVFPSVNAAWLISSEKFMANVPFISLLKIRSGYGLSGNDALDPYAWTSYFAPVHYMDRANGLILANIGNNEIQWETSSKISFGTDVHLFQDRIALSADIYNNHTKDLITLQPLPDVAGTGYYWSNGGELSNKGFEVSANIKMLNLKLLKWELNTRIGHYKNKIENLPYGDFTTSVYGAEILTSVGNPADVFYGYKTHGVFSSETEAHEANMSMTDEHGNIVYFGAGDVRFSELLEDGVINDNDKQIIGDPNPDFYGSFNNRFVVWKLTIDAMFTFSYGNDIYNYLRSELESGSSFINQTTTMLKRWYYEGQVTDQPKAVYNDPMGNARFSDRWIEDGSFLKFKSLSISYKIPVQNSVLDGMSIWASVNNLWTLTNYLGRDPEVSPKNGVLYQGIDTGLIPACRSYYFGIKLNL
jgi:TonB-linked SusC/RagA family outer membrane protein